MEKDDEVKGGGNSYDFGARMYDSRVGRWLSVDDLESKYPNLAPYNFVANMPIIAIDPDGKDIIIVYQWEYKGQSKMKQLKYSDGKLYTLDGKVWDGNGTGKTFFNAVKKDLNLLKNDHTDVKKVVNDLEDSFYNNFISNKNNTSSSKHKNQGDSDNEGIIGGARALDETDNDEHKGKGGTWTIYDPFRLTEEYTSKYYKDNYGLESDTGTKDRFRPARVTLGHEIFHAWEFLKKKMTLDSDVIVNNSGEKIRTSEIRAVKFENLIRRSANEPIRIKYNNKEIPKEKLK